MSCHSGESDKEEKNSVFDLFVGKRGRCGEEECMITLLGQKGCFINLGGQNKKVKVSNCSFSETLNVVSTVLIRP